MLFTEDLYINTKNAHTAVDRHPFVGMIRKNKEAGELYINFNKICIHYLEGVYDINLIDNKLHRGIDISDLKMIKSVSLEQLINRCRDYPLEHIYMFYLGLLFGGNMLSKMLPEYTNFLTFEEPKERINIVKGFLNKHIVDRDTFINNVNESYGLIKSIFDDMYDYLNVV